MTTAIEGWTLKSQDDIPAFLCFRPRPDQPDRYDQQTAFYDCQSRGVIWLLGGNGSGTTELAMAKTARFVYETTPPRRDTPFWVIAESYEQCMETCWKEKLFGHGHILPHDVDWDRVTWYSSKDGLPKRIPLKSPPGHAGKNWTLEFKSWNQGRGQMQARAIGGFCFVEQFPWGVFEEVLRGCREYNFPGSKLVEYTPVDPRMSGEIEEMISNGKRRDLPLGTRAKSSVKYLPDDWEVFHANTECALEAGHVDAEWYAEFFGMIPEEMRDVRQKGLFASFEGVIYKTFSPYVHVMGDEMFDRLDGCWHRRGIDWGAGPSNPFVCLWGARNSHHQWFIYDEYYSADQDKTTIDHLVEVYKRHEWENHPLFGLTYCDPSSPGNMRIAQKLEKYAPGQVQNFSMARANNSVLEGIEHVMFCLKRAIPAVQEDGTVRLEPRVFIHESCANLIKEIKGYRWLQPSADASLSVNPKSPRREPLKIDDHACFSAETLIHMADGTSKRICDVVRGEMVLTHLGCAEVLDAGMTGFRHTVRMIHELGETRCTPEHPMYHACHMHFTAVSSGDVTCVLREEKLPAEVWLKSLSGMGSPGDGIRNQDSIRFGNIFGDMNGRVHRESCAISGCTKKSGNSTLARSLKGSVSITKMATARTTRSRISNWSPHQITQRCIRRTFERLQKRQKIGTKAQMAVNGIRNMRRWPILSGNRKRGFVNTAVGSTRRQPDAVPPGSAISIVESPRVAREKLTRYPVNARSAESHFESENTRRLLPVRQPVVESRCLSVQRTGLTEPVFNLRTADGTYFADGILVSNCDAMRYMIFTDDGREGITIESARRDSAAAGKVPGGHGPNGSRWRDAMGRSDK